MFEITKIKKKKEELSSRLSSMNVNLFEVEEQQNVNGCLSCWNVPCEGSCHNTCLNGCGGCGKS